MSETGLSERVPKGANLEQYKTFQADQIRLNKMEWQVNLKENS